MLSGLYEAVVPVAPQAGLGEGEGGVDLIISRFVEVSHFREAWEPRRRTQLFRLWA